MKIIFSWLESFAALMRHRSRMKYNCFAALVLMALVTSCTPYQQQGAAMGGLAGGAVGAIAGGNTRSTLKGAAIGAGLGAGIAGLQENQRGTSNRNSPPPPPAGGSYPYAERTSTPGIVISPYAPYNVIDVQGLRPGTLALDTSCNKAFRIP